MLSTSSTLRLLFINVKLIYFFSWEEGKKGKQFEYISVCIVLCYDPVHHLIFTNVFFLFPLSQVTGERYCRAQQEAHHDSHTYLCLLASTRMHQTLHNLYHGKGERSAEEVAGLVGLRLPTQPGGKGWEK